MVTIFYNYCPQLLCLLPEECCRIHEENFIQEKYTILKDEILRGRIDSPLLRPLAANIDEYLASIKFNTGKRSGLGHL